MKTPITAACLMQSRSSCLVFFFSFIIAIVFFIRTVRSDWLILKINLFLAILALKCIPGLFLVPPSCSFGSC